MAAANGSGHWPMREDAKRPTSGCRFRRIPARVAATRPKDEGQPIPHLENCTGKTFRNCSREKLRFQSLTSNENSSQIRLQPFLNSLRKAVAVEARSSEKERRVDAKALIADEGRDKLR